MWITMGKTPSRERYEQENPVVSFRVSRETKGRLDDLVETLDTTKKDWFERVIHEQAQDVDAAWEDGYQTAKDDYCVKIPCVICDEPIELTDENSKREIASILMDVAHDKTDDLFWWRGHEDCL